MSIKFLKVISVLLMLLALGCVAGAILAENKRVGIQGPSALVVLPDQSVWVSVEDALWHLDARGKRLAIVDSAALGVGGLIGNLVLHPNGQMVAQTRNDPTLYFLDPETAHIKSRLLPQWQSDLGNHVKNAINYAFHQDGRVAIATDGGHVVAVFDKSGRFLARTKPDTYVFTNGLWWSADHLWTTDTNRQQLVELDGNTLIEKSRIQLSSNCGSWEFLGMAIPSQGKPSAVTNTRPLVTLVRFANGMTKGRVSDIFSDGSQLDYPATSATEPRGTKWHGNELLMVDGASYAIKRYADTRTPMDDFGDAQVQAEFAASLERRLSLTIRYYVYLAGAMALFLTGFAFALRAQMLEKAQVLAELNVDLSQLGTPILSALARSKAGIKLFSPLILMLALFVSFALLLNAWSPLSIVSPVAPLAVFLVLQLVLILAAIQVHRKVKRNEDNPAIEAIFNQRAVQLLQTDAAFWRLRRPDEFPQETWMFIHASKGANWLVLTNQRLLVFVVNLRDRTLDREYPRAEILRQRMLDAHEMTWMQKVQRYLGIVGVITRIEFKDGTSLTGYTHSAQTTRRISTLLQTSLFDAQAVSETNWGKPAHQAPPAMALSNKNAIAQTIASFLIPGLGQWIQRRSGTALVFFVIWLLALMSVIPVVWTVWQTLAAISSRMIFYTAGTYLVICILAAWDAWRMRKREMAR
ncbi:MAG: hypothetical protein WAO71_03810 [Gallionella sp.]